MTSFSRWFSSFLLCASLALTVFAAPVYFVDGDGDGVSDEIDDCAYTLQGTQVNEMGCPRRRDDADRDGVVDDIDDCPYTPVGAQVDASGCALDSDFDGIADGPDLCPTTAFAEIIDARGCAAGEVMRTKIPLSPPKLVSSVPVGQSVAADSSAELPQLRIAFSANSMRLGSRDLTSIDGYARVFLRQLAARPTSRLILRAHADRSETEGSLLAIGRMVSLRRALAARGIPLDRLRAANGVLDAGDPSSNRHAVAYIAE